MTLANLTIRPLDPDEGDDDFSRRLRQDRLVLRREAQLRDLHLPYVLDGPSVVAALEQDLALVRTALLAALEGEQCAYSRCERDCWYCRGRLAIAVTDRRRGTR